MFTASALAHPNIALIKYWGNRDASLRLPENGSLSINLDGIQTRTTVTFSPSQTADSLILNTKPIAGPGLTRVSDLLDLVRRMAGQTLLAKVESTNNFPTAAGIASSAAAFAALALAASAALGLDLTEKDLSRLARRGSGSACRSVPGGFVEWQAGEGDSDSYAFSIAPANHWDLVDCISVVSTQHKPTGSTEGHALASTSPLQSARVADAPRRLAECRTAVLEKDFYRLAEIVELDSNMMHAVMQTSTPMLMYWQPATLAVMQCAQSLRKRGVPAFYTIDAGANVHVWTLAQDAGRVKANLEAIPGVTQVLQAGVGGPAKIE